MIEVSSGDREKEMIEQETVCHYQSALFFLFSFFFLFFESDDDTRSQIKLHFFFFEKSFDP